MNINRCPGCYEPLPDPKPPYPNKVQLLSERYCPTCRELKIVKESWSPITSAGRIAGVFVQPSKRPWAR